MNKKMYKILGVLAILLIATATTAFASNEAVGPPPQQPDPENHFVWGFNGCYGQANAFGVYALNQAVASHHELVAWNVNTGQVDWDYQWYGGHHPNPQIMVTDFGITDAGFWWHWGYGGGYKYWAYVGSPPPCRDLDCHMENANAITRTDENGDDFYIVEYTYAGICEDSLNRNKDTGVRFKASGGLWLTEDAEGNDVDFWWIDGKKFSMAQLPSACGPWQVQLIGLGGVGGSFSWNPPGCK